MLEGLSSGVDGSFDSKLRSFGHKFDPANQSRNNQTSESQHSSLPNDISFLLNFGYDNQVLVASAIQARLLRVSASQHLIERGGIPEHLYFQYLATYLGIAYDDSAVRNFEILGELGNRKNTIKESALVIVRDSGPVPIVYVSPTGAAVGKLTRFLLKYPATRFRFRITTRSAIRQLFIANRSKALTKHAVSSLKERMPDYSASTIISVGQLFVFTAGLVIAAFWLIYATGPFFLLVHLVATSFYFLCVSTRMVVALSNKQKKGLPPIVMGAEKQTAVPVYSVLVALYQEENQVEELIGTLSKLQWPQSCLEINLICEEDDHATIAEVRKHIPGQPFELVIVPPSKPRTKPKALNFALSICTGEYIVIYDAEDRPHPMQLREAYAKFKTGHKNLACLQAPLVIHNHHKGWLPSMFALEYSALFSGLLPVLARWQTPIPLGGTSNHFKRSALEISGAWDPYNVTEDADLGIRLARMGYTTDVLKLPTREEAPVHLGIWIRQRTRWFKGWFQTWLVHMRNPRKMRKDLGLFNTFMFHALITGMILSALTHPFMIGALVYALYNLAVADVESGFKQVIALVDIINIFFAYAAFAIISWKALPCSGLSHLRKNIFWIPIYWVLISVASWRAVWHLYAHPFKWEKTPHGTTVLEPTARLFAKTSLPNK